MLFSEIEWSEELTVSTPSSTTMSSTPNQTPNYEQLSSQQPLQGYETLSSQHYTQMFHDYQIIIRDDSGLNLPGNRGLNSPSSPIILRSSPNPAVIAADGSPLSVVSGCVVSANNSGFSQSSPVTNTSGGSIFSSPVQSPFQDIKSSPTPQSAGGTPLRRSTPEYAAMPSPITAGGSGNGSSTVFSSQLVNSNSPTPYTDATQVRNLFSYNLKRGVVSKLKKNVISLNNKI